MELFNEAELFSDSAVKKEEEDSEEKELIDVPAHKRKKRGRGGSFRSIFREKKL